MKKILTVNTVAAVAAISALVFSNSFATGATIQNAGFETYIAASDSFAFWKADKDSTGGTLFDISQETTAPGTGTGSLKMEIKGAADTNKQCRISGSVTLPVKKIVTITAKVKYENLEIYWGMMFHMQQATCKAPDWKWIDRKWASIWGNNSLGSSDWTTISMQDTTTDSANVFNLIIHLRNSGTLWVDDVAITYIDLAPVTQKAAMPARQGSIMNNRITFSQPIPYSLEAYEVNGKLILKTAGFASAVNLENFGLSSGVYLIKAKTRDKIYIGRAVLGR